MDAGKPAPTHACVKGMAGYDAAPLAMLGEADTRAKLIDPAIHARDWTENLIRREETAGAIEIVDGKPRKRARGRVDYTLRVAVNSESQPVAVALIEAKAEKLPPGHGLEQGKLYASCKRMNVPFVFSCNGQLQSIHHVDKWKVVDEMHTDIPEIKPGKWSPPLFFLYTLGKPIKPLKVVKSGNIRNRRVRAMLDLLLTCKTISSAKRRTDKRIAKVN